MKKLFAHDPVFLVDLIANKYRKKKKKEGKLRALAVGELGELS